MSWKVLPPGGLVDVAAALLETVGPERMGRRVRPDVRGAQGHAVWVGNLLAIDRQVLPLSVESQTPPLATEA